MGMLLPGMEEGEGVALLGEDRAEREVMEAGWDG